LPLRAAAFGRCPQPCPALFGHNGRVNETQPASHIFAGEYLDRAARLRTDTDYLQAAREDPQSLYVPVWRGKSLLTGPGERRALWLSAQRLRELGADPGAGIFLGLRDQRAVFALEIGDAGNLAEDGEFIDLWRTAQGLPKDEAGILAYAKAMVEWHRSHRFCGRSGEPNVAASGGHLLLGARGARQFPRVDPAIIVLVTHDERCLLGRQQAWPEAHFSTIAGFVEPGESLEDAVRREVWEETNVELASVSYHSSQPWPFPSSLMVGYRAVAATTAILCNDQELADARWFSREELASGFPRLPPATSISFSLIESWFDERDGPDLRAVLGERRGDPAFGRRASSE
jgi:NAD+ diphosphatase